MRGRSNIVEFSGGPFDGVVRAYPEVPKPTIEVPVTIHGLCMTGVYNVSKGHTRYNATWVAPTLPKDNHAPR